jgi:glycosyltransferase involved in cell wall biosynthesis
MGSAVLPEDLTRLMSRGIGKGLLFYQRLRYRRQLWKLPWETPPGSIALHYGGVLSSPAGGLPHGGRIKLLHLNRVFPEIDTGFHILYLVSSAQPPFADELIRWAKGHGAKLVWNQNGVAYPAWNKEGYQAGNRIMRNLIRQADYVIYQSEFCRESADRFLGAISAPYAIVHNCVDLDLFSPPQTELPLTPWTLLAIGTHQQPERVLSVLRTAALLKERKREIRLLLAGRLDWSGAKREVDETIRRLGIEEQVIFSPPFTQDQAPGLYRQAHVLIHPKYKDPCPTAVIEALACGLPVVGSHSGGMPELVGMDGGLLIEVPESWDQMQYPSPRKMADAVEKIFSDLLDWQFKARERAVHYFDKNRWIDRHSEIFKMVLTGRA